MSVARFAPRAARDVQAAVRWIAQDDVGAATAFRNAVERAARSIGIHAEIGVLRPDLADEPYRFFLLTGFPFVIVYNSSRKPPLILRVLHGARDLPEILRSL